MFIPTYSSEEIKIFQRVKKLFEALPASSDDYENGFYDLVAQYGSGGGNPYLFVGGEYDDVVISQLSVEIENLPAANQGRLREFYEEHFLSNYFDEKADQFFYDDDDLAAEAFERFKAWIDDNFDLDEMMHDEDEEDEDEDDIEDDEDNDDLGDEDEAEEDEEDNPDNIFNQSRHYTLLSTKDFLIRLIKNFDEYQLEPEDVTVVAKMLMVIKNPKQYKMYGHLLLMIKEIDSPGNMRFQEIQLDSDGLQLTTGGYVTEDEMTGGDSYSQIDYPIDNEADAGNTVQIVDTFLESFVEKLQSQYREVDFSDSGDEIIKLYEE